MNLGKQFPDFKAETTQGPLQFSEYAKDSWCCLMSHPGIYTPVCTTELTNLVEILLEFDKRNVKLIAMSFGTKEKSLQWAQDILAYGNLDPSSPLPFPIICDESRDIGVKLGMIEPEKQKEGGLVLTARHCMIIGPDSKIKAFLVYPASTGRNMDEILRTIDSVQLTYKTELSTPVNWKVGGKVIVPKNLPKEKVDQFVQNVEVVSLPSNRNYLQLGDLK